MVFSVARHFGRKQGVRQPAANRSTGHKGLTFKLWCGWQRLLRGCSRQQQQPRRRRQPPAAQPSPATRPATSWSAPIDAGRRRLLDLAAHVVERAHLQRGGDSHRPAHPNEQRMNAMKREMQLGGCGCGCCCPAPAAHHAHAPGTRRRLPAPTPPQSRRRPLLFFAAGAGRGAGAGGSQRPSRKVPARLRNEDGWAGGWPAAVGVGGPAAQRAGGGAGRAAPRRPLLLWVEQALEEGARRAGALNVQRRQPRQQLAKHSGVRRRAGRRRRRAGHSRCCDGASRRARRARWRGRHGRCCSTPLLPLQSELHQR